MRGAAVTTAHTLHGNNYGYEERKPKTLREYVEAQGLSERISNIVFSYLESNPAIQFFWQIYAPDNLSAAFEVLKFLKNIHGNIESSKCVAEVYDEFGKKSRLIMARIVTGTGKIQQHLLCHSVRNNKEARINDMINERNKQTLAYFKTISAPHEVIARCKQEIKVLDLLALPLVLITDFEQTAQIVSQRIPLKFPSENTLSFEVVNSVVVGKKKDKPIITCDLVKEGLKFRCFVFPDTMSRSTLTIVDEFYNGMRKYLTSDHDPRVPSNR